MTPFKIVVAGIDPGLATSGLTCVEIEKNEDENLKYRVICAEVCRTKKSGRKERRADEDLAARLREILAFYHERLNAHKPVFAVMENLSFVRNASSSAKIGLSWGSIFAMCFSFNIPLFILSPQEIKRGCGLKRDASKDDVERVIRETMNFDWPTTGIREHVFDAAGAILAYVNTQMSAIPLIHYGICP